MKLVRASPKAIRIACTQYHYAKRVPSAGAVGYSVFNNDNEFCGVVLFGAGANHNIGTQFGLRVGQVMELTRVALNGKQETTSQVVATAIKVLKKDFPLLKLLVSYADIDQHHAGTIYQAMNWKYIGTAYVNGTNYIDKNGETRHARIVDLTKKKFNITREEAIQKLGFTENKTLGRHKYIYILDKTMLDSLQGLFKEYPKNASLV